LAQPHTVNPRPINVDKNAAYPKAATEMKKDGEPWRRSRLRRVKYLNNIVEQDHRRVKRLTDPGLGFGGFWTARRTLAGYESMTMIRKGQVRNIIMPPVGRVACSRTCPGTGNGRFVL
jgi:transposase, IS6 family